MFGNSLVVNGKIQRLMPVTCSCRETQATHIIRKPVASATSSPSAELRLVKYSQSSSLQWPAAVMLQQLPGRTFCMYDKT